MFFDTLSHLPQYLPETLREEVVRFMDSLTAETSDGEYSIRDQDIFARISSYTTEPLHRRTTECHRQFADIQFVLDGQENIYCYSADVLQAQFPAAYYDAARDVQFFEDVPAEAAAVLHISTAFFAVFFPQDAHRPQVAAPQEMPVKKAVIKIAVPLLRD